MDNDVIAVISNVICIKKDTLPIEAQEFIRSSLTRDNPGFHMMARLANANPRKYKYVKMPPASISSYDENDQTIYVPRGFKSDLESIIMRFGLRIKYYDKRVSFKPDPQMRMADGFELKEYQKKGLGSLFLNSSGILVAPCGGGKTVTGISLMVTVKQPTIILVHTQDLMFQWQRELASKAVLPCPVGQWGAGEKVRENVTVATIQTIVRMPPADARDLLSTFGCVILDEAHHCPAETFLQVMNLCPSKFRFGLTATPSRKDGLEFLMFDTIGPIVYEITDSDLENEGRSQNCSVIQKVTKFNSRFAIDEWAQLISELTKDFDRNTLIAETIHHDWMSGQFPIVISERTSHCSDLAIMLSRRGMNAQLLTGSVPKKQRQDLIARAVSGLVDVIIATKVADEGLDIPNLSSIHLVTPTSNAEKIKQRVGRIRRPVEGKKSLVYEYIDSTHSQLNSMAKKRLRMYKRWGFITI